MTAVRWALDNSWHTRPLLLARGSIEQWRAESAAHREGSFLSTLLATLGTVAHVDVAYPLASVGLALALIFLEGAHSSEALAAKLSLFGYYLLDSAASEDVAHVAATLVRNDCCSPERWWRCECASSRRRSWRSGAHACAMFLALLRMH